jgi:hypothetical protein
VMLFVSIQCAAISPFLSSCSPDLPVQRDAQQAEKAEAAPQYSIVCVIHGDGDYLYHDTSGNEYTADEEALSGAGRVAQHNPLAEVFIFHQRPRRHFLIVFPLKDAEFSYYRNGHLVAHQSYWRDQEQSGLDPEVELYRQYRAAASNKMINVFLYCGHEIPEFGGAGYDASYPDRPFTVTDFAEGIQGFTRDSARFDLMVLSTCYGGTPYTIGALESHARYIIASPDNLHLSYFDLHPLERLDVGLADRDLPAFAKRFARLAFQRLTGNVQTAVSVAVYDADRTQQFLHSVHDVYERTISIMGATPFATRVPIERCDCSDLPGYRMPTMGEGVDILYRPPRFGRTSQKQNHSGWECWKVSRPHSLRSETGDNVSSPVQSSRD